MRNSTSSLARASGPDDVRIRRGHALRALVVLCVLALVAFAAGTTLSLLDERTKELERHAHEISTLNRTLLEQTARAIDSVDFAIEAARLQLLQLEDAGMWSENVQHLVLESRVAKLPHLRSMVLIDRDERVLASSCSYPAPRVQAGECVGLTRLQAPEEDRLLVDGPTQSTLDGQWLLPVGRRLHPMNVGETLKSDLIVAAVEPRYFTRLYDELGADSGINIVLLMEDGTVVASSSHEPFATGASLAHHVAYIEYIRAGDHRDRIVLQRIGGEFAELVSFGKVSGLPLMIKVSIDEAAALSAWRKHATNLAFGVAGVALILITITMLLGRQVGRNEALSAALLDSETRQRGIIDSALDGIVATDVYGRVVLFNHAAERMFGCSAREALGCPLSRFMDGAVLAEADAVSSGDADRRGAPRTPGTVVEGAGVRQDGMTFPVEVSLSRLAHGDERLQIAMVRDITARKNAEESLRKFSRAVSQSASAVVITDSQGVIEYVNPSFIQTTGFSLEEVVGKTPRVLKSGMVPAARYAELWATISAGNVWHGEFHNRRKDGSLYWESAIISPIRDDAGNITHFVAIKDNITERKRAEAALAESHDKLREMAANLNNLRESEMARLARELHDELGQQLTGLKMDISWMQGRLVEGPAPLRDKVEAMKHLVDDTLKSVRRISTGLRPPVLDDLGLVPALEWLVGEFRRRHQLEVSLNLGVGEERYYDAKLATTLFRIVQESLTNIVRHAEASRVDISLGYEEGLHVLRIVDNGRGFEPGQSGGGLGLVGMRERAYMCGGVLEVSSTLGEGTVVVAKVPDRDSSPDGGMAGKEIDSDKLTDEAAQPFQA